jgi:aspartate kinase
MRIFKFGGASVKDAEGVKNLVKVLKQTGHDNLLVIVSAMGKTTNALEKVIHNYFNNTKELQSSIQDIKKYHNAILLDLFESDNHIVFNRISDLFKDLSTFFTTNKSPDYNFVYDQVVGYGELVSTAIVSAYLNEIAR